MNPYKLRAVVEFVREQFRDVEDGFDVDEAMCCLGLHRLLSPMEQTRVRDELHAIAEAESFAAQLRLVVQP